MSGRVFVFQKPERKRGQLWLCATRNHREVPSLTVELLTPSFEMKLIQAQTAEQIDEARRLFREYADWLQIDLCFQNFEQELADLPGDYVPPAGRLLLAHDNNEIAGCVALRKFDERICEMKRLFVRDQFRGRGLGRQLITAVIQEARQIGYEHMRLDTLPSKMNDAIRLYRSYGFKEIDSYYHNPVPGAIFMELELATVISLNAPTNS